MIRYKQLGYAELNVTDLARSVSFYRDIVGLQYVGTGDAGEVRFACSEAPYAFVLHQANVAGFKRVGWMLEDDSQFDNAQKALDQAGVAWEALSDEECAARWLGRAIRFVVPKLGATFEFYIPGDHDPADFEPTLAKIQRIGHVVFATPYLDEVVRFVTDVLNFRMSDSQKGRSALLRCFPSPWHHGLGLAQAPKNVFSHVNFMVTEIDDIGKGYNRLRNNDIPIVYGPGHHPLSSSIFLYWLDPDGLTVEYSFGMEEFSEVDARPARYVEPSAAWSDSWGAVKDPRGMAHGELEAYEIKSLAKT